jgi:hypothetical protein
MAPHSSSARCCSRAGGPAHLRARRWMLRLRRSPLSSRFCREGAATGVATSTGSADVADTRVRHHTSERVLARSENGFAVAADAGWRIARDDGRTNCDGLGLRGARRDGQKPKWECTYCKQELAHFDPPFAADRADRQVYEYTPLVCRDLLFHEDLFFAAIGRRSSHRAAA